MQAAIEKPERFFACGLLSSPPQEKHKGPRVSLKRFPCRLPGAETEAALASEASGYYARNVKDAESLVDSYLNLQLGLHKKARKNDKADNRLPRELGDEGAACYNHDAAA